MSIAERVLGVENISFLRSLDVQLVFLISIISSMGSIAGPALPAMSGALGISEARIGLVFTAFTFPAIVVLPIISIVADLYSRKAVVVPGILLFGVAGFSVGLAEEFRTILLLRGLQGIGYTAFNSLTVALLGDLLSGSTESAAQGARVILNKTTGFVGPAIAGVLAGLAWYYPFYLYGLAVPAGILVYFRLEGSVRERGRERDADTDTVVDTNPAGEVRRYVTDIHALVADPFIAGVLAAGFFRMFLKYTLYTFLALALVEQYGGSLGYAGFLVGLYSLIGAVVGSQSARFTEGLSHSYALLVGFVIASVAFLAFPVASGLIAVTALVLMHGVGEGIINPVHKSILSQSVDTDLRAGLVTSNAIVQNTAKTVTPVVLSPVLVLAGSSGYGTLFFLAGGVTLLTSLIAAVALAVGSVSERHRI